MIQAEAEVPKALAQALREGKMGFMDYYKLENLKGDTAMREGLEKGRTEGRAEGIAEGRAEGIAEGEKMKSIAIAKKMMAMGLDDDTIMQATGLPTSDIIELHKK